MTRGWDCKGEVVSFSAMAAVEFINVGLSTLYKAAAANGLTYTVLIAYSNAIGALATLPLIFIFPRFLLSFFFFFPLQILLIKQHEKKKYLFD